MRINESTNKSAFKIHSNAKRFIFIYEIVRMSLRKISFSYGNHNLCWAKLFHFLSPLLFSFDAIPNARSKKICRWRLLFGVWAVRIINEICIKHRKINNCADMNEMGIENRFKRSWMNQMETKIKGRIIFNFSVEIFLRFRYFAFVAFALLLNFSFSLPKSAHVDYIIKLFRLCWFLANNFWPLLTKNKRKHYHFAVCVRVSCGKWGEE